MKKSHLFILILVFVIILSIASLITAPVALVAGVLYSIAVGNPMLPSTQRWSKQILQWSIVGMGFGISLTHAAKSGVEGLLVTVVSISFTLAVGLIIGKRLRLNRNTSVLIASGTAICGGSAIAAISPVIGAKEEEMSVSLATVFLLNAVALLIFPTIGRLLGMSSSQFGLWSAIAIHDTSSVVGAASTFGKDALNIATTIKLERSLWIVPVSLLFSFAFGQGKKRAKIPLFIVLFIVAMVAGTYLGIPGYVLDFISTLSRRTLNVALFLVGAGLSVGAVKKVGVRPIAFGLILWLLVGVLSALAIERFL